MAIVKANKDNFDAEVLSAKETVLVDFYADWCGPCRMLSPIIDEIANERNDIAVGKINVDNEPELAEKFGVFSIPTLVIIKNGEIAHQSAGARPKAQIIALLEG